MGATDQGILSRLPHNQGQLYMQSLRTLSIRGSHFLSCRPHPILYRPLGTRPTEMDVRIGPCRGFAILNLIEVGPLLRMDECYDSTRSLDKSPSSEYHHSHERRRYLRCSSMIRRAPEGVVIPRYREMTAKTDLCANRRT